MASYGTGLVVFVNERTGFVPFGADCRGSPATALAIVFSGGSAARIDL